LLEKLFSFYVGIAERASQRVTVNLIMVRENDHSAIGVLHLHVAAFAVYFDKPEPRKGREHLLA
jgi:hypothetical protein